MKIEWEEDFKISTRIENGATIISANKAGLLSLSKQLATLAEQEGNEHYHLDSNNSLEDGSSELIIEKVEQLINCFAIDVKFVAIEINIAIRRVSVGERLDVSIAG